MRKSDYSLNRAPVLGSVLCGSPELAEEDFEEFVALPVALFGQGDFFVLHTHGDSMIDAGIDEGDMVVVTTVCMDKINTFKLLLHFLKIYTRFKKLIYPKNILDLIYFAFYVIC